MIFLVVIDERKGGEKILRDAVSRMIYLKRSYNIVPNVNKRWGGTSKSFNPGDTFVKKVTHNKWNACYEKRI